MPIPMPRRCEPVFERLSAKDNAADRNGICHSVFPFALNLTTANSERGPEFEAPAQLDQIALHH